MKTTTKMGIAKAAYQMIRAGRYCVGLGDHALVERHGVKFDLDLAEGIDLAIYIRGYFEPSTAIALSRTITPGSTVLDIGANVGAHTLHMARHVGPAGRVFAFEPTDFAFRKLQTNLALNPALADRVLAEQCFLASEAQANVPELIYSSWPLSGGENLHAQHLGQSSTTTKAVSRTLDSVLAANGAPKIQLIKLDVDGFECDVLAGAQETLRRDRPIFVMELAPYVLAERGGSLQGLLTQLVPLGYRFFDEKTGRPVPNDQSGILRLIADGEGKNIIARVD